MPYPCCQQPRECLGCDEGTAPAQYQLDVPEETFAPFGGAFCDTCEAYTGSFLLDFDPSAIPFFPEIDCVWRSALFEACDIVPRDEWSEPLGPPELKEYWWQAEMTTSGPGLVLVENGTPPQIAFQWIPDPEIPLDGDCQYDELALVFHSIDNGLGGCLADEEQVLLLSGI